MSAPAQPFDLADFLAARGVEVPVLRILDIGAMDVGEADPWQPLVARGLARVVGFEPDAEQHARLVAGAHAGATYLPHALGDGGTHTLHIGAQPMTSSLFPPDEAVMRRFHNLWELSETVRTERVRTVRLDEVAEARPADFVKIDVQGAEILVLENATGTLAGCIGVITEVCFVPIYRGQPLFADIDSLLRARGFSFHAFFGAGTRPYRPLLREGNPNRGFAQMLWSNALYFRDAAQFPALAGREPEAMLRTAMVAHTMFGAYDFAAFALQHYGATAGGGHATAYIRALMDADPAIGARR